MPYEILRRISEVSTFCRPHKARELPILPYQMSILYQIVSRNLTPPTKRDISKWYKMSFPPSFTSPFHAAYVHNCWNNTAAGRCYEHFWGRCLTASASRSPLWWAVHKRNALFEQVEIWDVTQRSDRFIRLGAPPAALSISGKRKVFGDTRVGGGNICPTPEVERLLVHSVKQHRYT